MTPQLSAPSSTKNIKTESSLMFTPQHRRQFGQHSLPTEQSVGQRTPKLPMISTRVLDEAVKLDMISLESRERLITDPNKYSIFFCRMSSDSPNMREAMREANCSAAELELQSYEGFKRREKYTTEATNDLQLLIDYLTYVTNHYDKLKAILRRRANLKRMKSQQQLSEMNLKSSYNLTQSHENYSMKSNENTNQVQSRISNTNSNHFLSQFDLSMSSLLESRAQKSKLRTMKEEQNFQKFVEISLEKRHQLEEKNEKKMESILSKVFKSKKSIEASASLRAQAMQKKLDEAASRWQRMQDKQEDLAAKKANEMIMKQEKAEQIKANALKEQRDKNSVISSSSIDSKSMRLKELREAQEEQDNENRVQLMQSIDEKHQKSVFFQNSQTTERNRRVETHSQKYSQIIDIAFERKKTQFDGTLSSYISTSLMAQANIQNKEKRQQTKHEERMKDEKAKLERLKKVQARVEFKNDRSLDAITKKIEKDDTRIEVHESILKTQQGQVHDRRTRSMKRVASNLNVRGAEFNDWKDKIMQKQAHIADVCDEKKRLVKEVIDASRVLSFSLSKKRQELLEKIA